MKDAAIEIMVYEPQDPTLPEDQRGVVVNPHLRERFEQFVPIGVFLEGSDLRYYFFEQCDKNPKIYPNLEELKEDLPAGLKEIFENKPKIFMMGHANGGIYGLGNCHGESEHIHDAQFDNLLLSLKQSLPEEHQDLAVTIEGCNTDNQLNAEAYHQEKTFLERVSLNHPEITFGGTAPWISHEPATGSRSLAPEAPITSMAGNVWKAGNSVIFFHGNIQHAVRKSLFATTQTAKELKINTVECAREILGKDKSGELISKIALSRDILKIQDLEKMDAFPNLRLVGENISKFIEQENKILVKEQETYTTRVHDILERAEPVEQLNNRDVVELLLGLKEPSVFKGHEDMLASMLANEALMQLAMVSCGKVLIGGPSNDSVIDLLLNQGVDINSADKKGMTALHYAVQNFYNYREEPLNLIKKLLASGANIEAMNEKGQTPIDIAEEHSKDTRVAGSDKLLASLNYADTQLTSIELKQTVTEVFQMSQHMADELLSLPDAQREYSKCSKGTLFIPSNAVEKLHQILQSAQGNYELLSEFESTLDAVTHALQTGNGTGEVLIGEEFVSKRFEDATLKLEAVTAALADIKREATELSGQKSSSQYKDALSQLKESQPGYMKPTESSKAKEREKFVDATSKPSWKL